MSAVKSLGNAKTPLRLVLIGLLAAATLGGVLSQRAPDPSIMPSMAERPVTLPNGNAIYVQRHEVSVAEWNTCNADGACTLKLRVRPDQDAALTPATGLSYVDVQEYLTWINAKSGHSFRLPTASEWEHMAASVLNHGAEPLFTDPSLTWASTYLVEGITPRALKPQGSFSTSPEGIADLDGSVWEWTQDCYAGVSEGVDPARCPAFFVGGEHVAAMSYLIRDPARGGCAVGSPPAHLGMRLVSDEAV
ncbi:formylglycine-generating enzyme family protein [Roseovarius nanhaiticus]|uniref:Formylglycine-generating enzyme, required for sulfatase activity, contains SUMF1/FGE domain n=1 Tax=Roseovarius nanhaiticus TaxID=573024 RepID=A0A1N7GY34_9RHOB|nr:SUMF1/EgtB/PvdO family nonheme iron enzyme [Roseovarius nanhaiticus]SEL20233.1 Formylglycine-generating enzyme, required for sulfatase activity, contains SUMF1/FGE domain [Roseovarius nanhaiticus]SIS17430.1 Formylglycine-generating enzyme, required for sulfatase activity, contains SUMF1/FGE domain [Roseovarius nanhaiticus]